MAKKEKIFNDRKRKVFRKHIPSTELMSSLMVALVLVMAGIWFFAQRENYDPSERDISMELMVAGSVEDRLYRTPLQRWMDPATAHAAGPAGHHLGIFPEDLLSGGWQPSTRLQEFDESTLYEKINGAAPQYYQFGFQRLHFIGIEQPMLGLGVNIELYDMGEYQNALGIFNAQRAAERVVQQQDNIQFYNTGIGAIGVVGPYYFKFTGDTEGELIEEKATQLIEALNTAFSDGDSTPPHIAAFQRALEIPFDGLSYEKTDVFQFGFAQDFWFGTPSGADAMRYFVHEAADTAAAETLYTKLLENLLFDHAQVESTAGSAVLKHNFLNTYFVLQQAGALVFGAENVPDLEQVEHAANLIRTALANEEEAY